MPKAYLQCLAGLWLEVPEAALHSSASAWCSPFAKQKRGLHHATLYLLGFSVCPMGKNALPPDPRSTKHEATSMMHQATKSTYVCALGIGIASPNHDVDSLLSTTYALTGMTSRGLATMTVHLLAMHKGTLTATVLLTALGACNREYCYIVFAGNKQMCQGSQAVAVRKASDSNLRQAMSSAAGLQSMPWLQALHFLGRGALCLASIHSSELGFPVPACGLLCLAAQPALQKVKV